MKTFVKIVSVLLVIMLALPLAACGKTETTPSKEDVSSPTGAQTETVTPTEEEDQPPFVLEEGFGGETVRFFVNRGQDDLATRSIAIGEDDDETYEVNVMTMERNSIVEESLDVKIAITATCGMQEIDDVLKPILMSHISTFDVVCLYQYFDLGMALGDTVGSFYNYSNMPEGVTNYINLEADYWSQAVYDTLSLNNTGFFLTGDLAQTYLGAIYVSYVNARMWNEYSQKIKKLQNNPEGYTSIYDIVKNGYWTLDLWMELSQMAYEDSNDNEKHDFGDQIGLLTFDKQLDNVTPDMLACGSHITYSKLDENGMPIISINSKENLAFADKLYQLLVESDAVCTPKVQGDSEDGGNMHLMEMFARGNTLLVTNQLSSAEIYLADMKDDFYVMPLPMFDRNQFDPDAESRGYSTQIHDCLTQYAICKDIGNDRVPMVTATMELLGYYSKKLVTPAYYDKALKDRYTRNPQDAEIIDMIREGLYIDFGTAWSQRLGNITWHFRQNYDSTKRAQELKKLAGTASLNMKQLRIDLEEAYWVE